MYNLCFQAVTVLLVSQLEATAAATSAQLCWRVWTWWKRGGPGSTWGRAWGDPGHTLTMNREGSTSRLTGQVRHSFDIHCLLLLICQCALYSDCNSWWILSRSTCPIAPALKCGRRTSTGTFTTSLMCFSGIILLEMDMHLQICFWRYNMRLMRLLWVERKGGGDLIRLPQ